MRISKTETDFLANRKVGAFSTKTRAFKGLKAKGVKSMETEVRLQRSRGRQWRGNKNFRINNHVNS